MISSEKFTWSISEEIEDLFGPPPLLGTESRKDYDDLLAGFSEQWKPKNLIEWIWVRDIADCEFTARRYERIRHSAETMIVRDLISLRIPRHAVELQAIARAWLGQPAERHGLTKSLASGLDDARANQFPQFKAKWNAFDDLNDLAAGARSRAERAREELMAYRDRISAGSQSGASHPHRRDE